MEVKNIYYVDGNINDKGLYEKKADSKVIIAECKEDNVSGVSYYAFKNVDSKTNEEFNNNMIRLRSLMSLVESLDIEVKKVTSEEQFKRLNAYFMTIVENKKMFNENNHELLKK